MFFEYGVGKYVHDKWFQYETATGTYCMLKYERIVVHSSTLLLVSVLLVVLLRFIAGFFFQ